MKKSLIFFVFIMLFNITFLSASDRPAWYENDEYFKRIYGNDIFIVYGRSEDKGELAVSLIWADQLALETLGQIMGTRFITKKELEEEIDEIYFSKIFSNNKIIGAKKVTQYISSDGSVYVAYIISESNVNKSIEKSKIKENKKANVFTEYKLFEENTKTTKISRNSSNETENVVEKLEIAIKANDFTSVKSFKSGNNISSNKYSDKPFWFDDIDGFYIKYGSNIIIGIGTAKEKDKNTSLKYAENYALASISNQIEISCSSELIDNKEEKSDSSGSTSIYVMKSFITVKSENEIRNAKKVEEYISPSGRVYVAYILNILK